MELNKTAIGIAAGVAGTLFLGYCIYFDNKRRKDPDYKKKVRERKSKMSPNFCGCVCFFIDWRLCLFSTCVIDLSD